ARPATLPASATLDPDVMKNVVAIAETGSLTHAAQRVGRTPAALSMQLKKLEDMLGVRLFCRDRQGMEPTQEGERLLPHARRLIAAQQEALDAFRYPALSGSVRLGAIDDLPGARLEHALGGFARSHPDVTVNTVMGTTRLLAPMLEADELDLVILSPGGTAPWQPADRIVSDEPLVWATRDGGDAWRRRPLPVAVATTGCAWRRMTLEALDRAAMPYRIAYQSDFLGPQQAAVMADLAVAPIPRSAIQPGMRQLRPSEGFERLGQTRIALRLGADPSQAVLALAERIAECCGAAQD
ncbi:MAG: LysR family transcriptional regulator, partial [Pseudomonadota bacterium]